MLGTILTFMAEAIGGLVLLAAAVVWAVWSLGRGITQAMGHDQATCQCYDCVRRRSAAVDKYILKRKTKLAEPKKRDLKSGWYNTEELRTGMRISTQSGTYEIVDLRGRSFGTEVWLSNMRTHKRSMVLIRAERRSVRVWKRVD